MAPTIGLLGDVMLGRVVADALERTAPEEVWSREVRELAAECDVVVANLECCVSDRGQCTTLVPGKPFFFRAPPRAAVRALRAVGADAVGLANNHALDFGPEALADTLEHLAAAGIAIAGAGPSVEDARRGVVVGNEGVRVGLLAVSDHPSAFAAGPESPGIAHAWLADGLPDWVADELARLRQRADLVVAFPHWGPNMTLEPAPWQRDRARELLAAGADLVAGHSAHVFHGVERVGERLVAYDLGDAVDDYVVDPELRNDLGVLARWHPGEEAPLELVGLRLEFAYTRLAQEEDADWIASRLERACAELGTSVERSGEQHFLVR